MNAFRDVLRCGVVIAGLGMAAAAARADDVHTNQALALQLAAWHVRLDRGDATSTLKEVEKALQTMRWSTPVFTGTNWTYTWGYCAWMTAARALDQLGRQPEAYRACVYARAVMPPALPSASHAADYLRWFSTLGDLCLRMGRNQDAAWHFDLLRSATSPTGGFYRLATARLASIRLRQGRCDDARELFAELFALDPRQPTPVWHDYISLLFATRRYEEGVAALIAGARMNGFSPRFVERDYFIADACRYAHHFQLLDVLEWYDVLGVQLGRTKLERGTEDLVALLINTRRMILKAYPEVRGLAEDDLRELKARLARERAATKPARPAWPDVGNTAPQPAGAIPHGNAAASTAPPVFPDAQLAVSHPDIFTNMLVEEAVNRVLLAATDRSDAGSYEVYRGWNSLLARFDDAVLGRVTIDGVSARFLAYAGLGTTCALARRFTDATNWLSRAEELGPEIGNGDRMAEAVLTHANVLLTTSYADTNKAVEFLEWARTLGRGNQSLDINALEGLAGIAFWAAGTDARIAELGRIADGYGDQVPRSVFERLARSYYWQGDCRRGFATLADGLARTRLKMLEGRFDHLLDALLINRQAHTAAEVRQLRTMTRAAVLRFPATVEMAPVCAQLLAIADGPALVQELRLAMIEESGDISDAAWQAVSNAAHSLPCVRAGRLYMALQAARLPVDSMLDWSGWVAALDAAAGECAPHAPTGVRVGGIELARKALMRPLFLYAARLPARDADAVQAALCRLVRALNTTDFNRVVALFEGRGNTNAVIELHAARVGSFATPSPPDPSFKALVALEPTMTSAQRSWCAGLMASLARRETDAGRRSDWEAYHALFQARE